jgi:clan AA aspartic protease (TIGR02281 family)
LSRRLLLIPLLAFAAESPAFADTVYLKSGKNLEGTVQSESRGQVVLNIGYGTVTLDRSEIVRVRRSSARSRGRLDRALEEREFESGLLVPKRAAKLHRFFSAVLNARDAALDAKARDKSLEEEISSLHSEIANLKERDAEMSASLADLSPSANPAGYNEFVSRLNAVRGALRSDTLRIDDDRKREKEDGHAVFRYVNAYGRLQDYLRGEGRRRGNLRKNGLEARYYRFVRSKARIWRKDFERDSVLPESTLSGGNLVVKALINGKVPARLMVDTGASSIVLYDETSAALRVDPDDRLGETMTTVADGRLARGKHVRLRSVSVGRSVIRNVDAILLPGHGAGFDGLLGMSFLKHFAVRVEDGHLVLESLK